jgi:hypothetical protein
VRILRFKQHNPDGTPTDDFFQEHLARATASRAAAILDFTQKGVEGSTRRLYRLEKVAEIMSGIAVSDHYVSMAMKAGTFAEPKARLDYQLEEEIMVDQVGMVVADDERFGWSPDGLCGDNGAIEIKGPQTTTHLQTLDAGAIPEDNLPQLYFAFFVHPGLEWIDFISRDGGMSKKPENFGAILPRRFVQCSIRLERKDCLEQIAKMKEAAEKFMDDVQATVDRISAKVPELPEEPPEVLDPELGITDDLIRMVDPNWRGEHAI